MTAPLLLLIATQPGGAAARLAGRLRRAGFRVQAAAPAGHLLHHAAAVEALHPLSHLHPQAGLVRALEAAQPDLAIPCDDLSAALLVAIHAAEPRLRALVERSMGDPRSFPVALAKSAQVAHAAALGIPVPPTIAIPDRAAFDAAIAGGLPRVLKADGTWGGAGVAVIRRPEEASPAWEAATTRPPLRAAASMALREGSARPLLARARWRPGTVCLQGMVEGRPANRAVVCEAGRVIAGVSLEVVRTLYPLGPAAVVRAVDHPGMAAAAAAMVESLGLSGLHGFDFMLEAGTDRALLIEQNPRATPACALDPAGDGGLAAAWFAHLAGLPSPALPEGQGRAAEPLGLFPGAWLSDPADPLLQTDRHDVPWEDPGLLRATMAELAAWGRVDRWKARLGRGKARA